MSQRKNSHSDPPSDRQPQPAPPAAKSDFTRGPILRQMVSFSTPIMATNLLQTSFQLVDNLWVGNLLGAQALGAVAISSTIIFTVLSFVIGMNNAALTILSQHAGRGDSAGLSRYLNTFIIVFFAGAMLLGGIGLLATDFLLQLMATPAEILPQARAYLRITFLGLVFLFGYTFIATALRSVGDSRTPMRFITLAVILNTGLDPLLIMTMGIEGAALATVISQGLAFIYGVIHVWRRRLLPIPKPHLPSWEAVRTTLVLGIPAGLQMSVISAGSAAVMSVVAAFGSDVVGGYGAAIRLDSLIVLPAQALGTAASAMAGQNIALRNWGRVNRIAQIGVVYIVSLMIAIALVLILIAGPAIELFISESPAAKFGARYVRIVALCYPFLGINFVLNGIVRASGAMYQVLVLNIVSFWVLRYPLTAVAAHIFGEDGLAIGVGGSFMISSVVAFAYFRYGGWRKTQLFA